MIGLLVCAVGVVTLAYLWLSHHYRYWSKLGVVQPSTLPFIGNMLPVILKRRNVGLILDDIYRRYPGHDAVGVYSLLTPKLLVRNPRLAQRVLISDFSSFHDNDFYVDAKLDPLFALDPFCLKGEEWKPVRAKLMATLTVGKLKEIFPLMKDIIPRLDAYLEEQTGQDIEAKELATLFTMDNVSNCVFGVSSDCFRDPDAAFRRMADAQMKDTLQSWWRMLIVHLVPTLQSLLRLRFIPTSVNDFIHRIVTEVFEYRKKNGIARNDLFQLFMKKATAADKPLHEMLFFGSTFFLEGFETSSMVAGSVLYELALNPGVQQTLRDELMEVLGDRYDPDFDTLNSLSYLDKVIQESQRKYPIMYTLNRVCTKSVRLNIDGFDVQIEPGTPVMLPVFSVHRDPQYYPDPERFDPERFSEENKGSRPPCTFLPFGDGPRMCPGTKFGLVQVKLLISSLVYKYNIVKCDTTPESLTMATGAFMLVSNELKWIRVEKRA